MEKKGKKRGGANKSQGPRHPRPENTQSRRQQGGTEGGGREKKKGGGGGDKPPRPKAPGAGKHGKQDTTGAQRGGGRGKGKEEKK